MKSECALIAAWMLSAVVLLLEFGLKPSELLGADDPAASLVNVTVVPSDFVSVSFVPTAMFAKSVTVTVQLPLIPPILCLCHPTTFSSRWYVMHAMLPSVSAHHTTLSGSC